MNNILIPTGIPKERRAELVTAETAHLWREPLPIHPTYKTLLRALLQLCPELKALRVYIDFSLPTNTQIDPEPSHKDVGFFQAQFDHWTAVLNWTEEKRGHLLPDYIGVDFGGESAGILGPWANIRTCWACGLTGWRDPEGTPMHQRRAAVQPNRPCPRCFNRDWWAALVTQDDLIEAASSAVANAVQKPHVWEDLGGRDAELRKQGIKAGAYVME